MPHPSVRYGDLPLENSQAIIKAKLEAFVEQAVKLGVDRNTARDSMFSDLIWLTKTYYQSRHEAVMQVIASIKLSDEQAAVPVLVESIKEDIAEAQEVIAVEFKTVEVTPEIPTEEKS